VGGVAREMHMGRQSPCGCWHVAPQYHFVEPITFCYMAFGGC